MAQQIKTFQLNIDTELLLPGNPVTNLGASTKQYVDDSISTSETFLTNTIGVASVVSSGINYTVLNNGLIYYYNILYTAPVGTSVAILPIANNSGTMVYWTLTGSSGFGSNLSISGITTTGATFVNTTASPLTVTYNLIAI